MRNVILAGAVLLLAAGCSDREQSVEQIEAYAIADVDEAPQNEFGFAEALEQDTLLPSTGPSARMAADMAASGARNNAEAPSSVPSDAPVVRQIAYSYNWGFRVDAGGLPVLQQRHRALCEAMGEDCRILSLSQSGESDNAYGRVRLQVIARRATEFGEQLAASTEGVDAEQVSFAIEGEDLTDQITDTQAHLAGRRLLRDRLMEVLRSRQGSVADLVAAERGVAEVNEEIDAATARLATMRNSVAYSAVEIEYDPMLGQYRAGFARPIGEAISNAGTTLGVVIAAIIYLLVALLPIILLVLTLRWVLHRFGLRLRFWRKQPAKSAVAETAVPEGETPA
ncbi:MAG: DUF4349 domain-containing protein [Alteraurantiacibacter sp.]